MGINKNQIRQDKLDERKGPVSRPAREVLTPIQHVMGPGSRFTQDKYGDSGFHSDLPYPSKLTPSKSDVFGSEAAPHQGFRLRKPTK